MPTKIVDRFGRPHSYLRISLTDRCNLRCFYCMPEEGIQLMDKAHIMTLEEIISIARTFHQMGVNKIRLTGGEPLVRKNFDHLVRELSKLKVNLRLTTNGILLDRFLETFRQTGLNQINISLDTLDKAKSIFMTKRNYFDTIMRNIQLALEQQFEIKLNVVLIKGVNDQEIPEFLTLTKDHPLSVKFIEFMPFKGNKWNWDKGISKEDILQSATKAFGTPIPLDSPKHSTSVQYKIKGFTGSFGIVSTITNPFCSDCNRIRLTADGKMKNCLFATSETDLLTPFRNGEQLEPLILNAIRQKRWSRDGMNAKMEVTQYEKNRSMISIGG